MLVNKFDFKMKIFWFIFFILSCLACYGLSIAFSQKKEDGVVRGVWRENKTIILKNKKIIIPTYLPYEDTEKPIQYYWASDPSSAHWPNYYIDFSKEPNCNGAHVCSHTNFSVYSIPKDTSLAVQDAFSRKYQLIIFDPFIMGYYVPSVCYSYCTTVKLVWFVPGKMFIIAAEGLGNAKPDIAELKKSALTVINQYPIVKER
jgi:hypothetical protein